MTADAEAAEDEEPLKLPKRLFKTGRDVETTIRCQLAHMLNDCLSNPDPAEGF